jgi:prepilin-type N-terminal cleavage/methylation domain-containing protein
MRSNPSKFNADERMRGFTLIELMIVGTIILVIGAISIPKFIQLWQNVQLRAAAAEVADLTQRARMSAARANATYPVRFQMNGGVQQVYIDLNNNSSLDANEPYLDLPQSVTGASGAPNGSGGQPTAYTLVGDSSSGTPFDNSNVIAYSPRGLPCNYTSSVCATPAASYFVFYFQDSRTSNWAAVLVTKSGRSRVLTWNGGSWK